MNYGPQIFTEQGPIGFKSGYAEDKCLIQCLRTKMGFSDYTGSSRPI